MEPNALGVKDDNSRMLLDGAPQAGAAANGHVQRRESRSPTNWIGMIRLLDGSEIPCTVKDVSPSGACLGVPASVSLPETFMLKVVGRDFVCLVRLAWRRSNLAGVRIERIGKLASKTAASSAQVEVAADDYKSVGTRHRNFSSSY